MSTTTSIPDDHDESPLNCPDCGSTDTYEDRYHRLHCIDCGEINDAYLLRYHRRQPKDLHDAE